MFKCNRCGMPYEDEETAKKCSEGHSEEELKTLGFPDGSDAYGLICPLCHDEAPMERRGKGKNTIWVCRVCPCIIFEYYDETSTASLISKLD